MLASTEPSLHSGEGMGEGLEWVGGGGGGDTPYCEFKSLFISGASSQLHSILSFRDALHPQKLCGLLRTDWGSP